MGIKRGKGKRRDPATPESDGAAEQPDKGRWDFAPGCVSELEGLTDDAFAGLTDLMERHQAGKTRAGSHFKPMGDGLYELLYEHSNNNFRLIFFPWNGLLIGLAAFAKNQEKTPRKDLRRAQTRAKDWMDAHPKPDKGRLRNKK